MQQQQQEEEEEKEFDPRCGGCDDQIRRAEVLSMGMKDIVYYTSTVESQSHT